MLAGKPLAAKLARVGSDVTLTLAVPQIVEAGQTLTVVLHLK
jgi:hypothetical protein